MNVKELLQKLDYFYEQGRLKDAEKLLVSSAETATEDRNYSALLTIYNEMEGLYRTTGRAGKASEISDKALELISLMRLENTVHHATTLQNGATANRVAGNNVKALDMYSRAAEIYKKLGYGNSYQMASLYNNISHIYQHQNDHKTALEYLTLALKAISKLPENEAEIATTKICMSLSHMAMNNFDDAEKTLNDALSYYESDIGKNDGHYGSALSAKGEFLWRKKGYNNAIITYEKALDVTLKRFGENYGCKIIRENIDKIRKEMETV